MSFACFTHWFIAASSWSKEQRLPKGGVPTQRSEVEAASQQASIGKNCVGIYVLVHCALRVYGVQGDGVRRSPCG